MAPCLSDDLVKAFAKQMIFYSMYQARRGPKLPATKNRYWWINQMRGWRFSLWRPSGDMEFRTLLGAPWCCQDRPLLTGSFCRPVQSSLLGDIHLFTKYLHAKRLFHCQDHVPVPGWRKETRRRQKAAGAKSYPSKGSPGGSIKWLGSHRSCYNCHVTTSCYKRGWSL